MRTGQSARRPVTGPCCGFGDTRSILRTPPNYTKETEQ
jgi:hypothetical protein